jgi:hypothetical protein
MHHKAAGDGSMAMGINMEFLMKDANSVFLNNKKQTMSFLFGRIILIQ